MAKRKKKASGAHCKHGALTGTGKRKHGCRKIKKRHGTW